MSLKDPFGWHLDVEVESSWGLSCLEVLIQQDDKSKSVLKKFMGFDAVGNEVSDNPGSVMNNILKKRCMDEKAAVREAALLVISKLTSLSDSAPDEDFLKTLGMACSDPLAFRIFTEGSVVKEWLHSIPRLITDNESSIQEECENLFLELVLDRISRAGSSNSLNHASESNSNGKAAALEMKMELLYPQGVLDKWTAPPGEVVSTLRGVTFLSSSRLGTLIIIGSSLTNLAHNLLQRLEEFNMHSTEVNAHVKALRTLCKRALNPQGANKVTYRNPVSAYVIHVNLLEGRHLYYYPDYCRETMSSGEECFSFGSCYLLLMNPEDKTIG
ncbi:hypothetical protein HAX54_052315 [Datura stramonium]|uniref:ARM repeat superfamily protein n=1 Tax=Datura stramonium TaxID=4076 RepID=A0ABS8SZQ1_DATST|nr:hypothetical protein [Datura stramonium]